MRSRFIGKEHPDTIDVMENLAITSYYLQKYKDAASLEAKVADVRRKVFGEEHPQTVKAVAFLAAIRLTPILQKLNPK